MTSKEVVRQDEGEGSEICADTETKDEIIRHPFSCTI